MNLEGSSPWGHKESDTTERLTLSLPQVLVSGCRIWFPDWVTNPGPLDWEPGVLATGPPGKSPHLLTTLTPTWCSVAQSVQLLGTLWTMACQASLSMGFFRQEYWSGWPCPPPGVLSDPGIEPRSPALEGGFFTTEPPGKPTR